MGRHSDQARETLLDAAEELYARYGIDAVSNRRITEHAGSSNHSAITYHFGGTDEFLHALLGRHIDKMSERRRKLTDALGSNAGLHEVIACRILPWVEQLATLPHPSWRARFLYQVRTAPSVATVLTEAVSKADDFQDLSKLIEAEIGDISPTILQARAGMLGDMVLGICSEYEERMQEGNEKGTWLSVGYFLIDATAGMLAAPVTHPEAFLTPSGTPPLV